jgi:hypothetical protein
VIFSLLGDALRSCGFDPRDEDYGTKRLAEPSGALVSSKTRVATSTDSQLISHRLETHVTVQGKK